MKSDGLHFSAPVLNDAARIRSAAVACRARTNDLSFANIYLLQRKYDLRIAFKDDCMFRYYAGNAQWQGYAFPACFPEFNEEALDLIEKDAAACRRALSFCMLTIEQRDFLSRRYGERLSFAEDRGNADYLYKREDLAHLPGTAYHRKRNHIARFERLHPRWRYEELTLSRAKDALDVAHGWLNSAEDSPALQHEARAIRQALDHLNKLGLTGGLIYVDDAPAAMSLASCITPDIADIHYEKCLPEFRDAYPLINRELARRLDCAYINREEDLNIPGLRKAKLSYHPCQLISRFSAVVC